MKNIIIYSVIFIVAFAATSFVIISANNTYENIFAFDLREKIDVESAIVDSTAKIETDELMVADSLHAENKIEKKEKSKENKSNLKSEVKKIEQTLALKEKEIEELKSSMEQEETAQYQDWLKNTIKLYEAMESNKAAQFIKTIPEQEARDLIYSMKKKKAAEILSHLNIETVQRLTKAKP